MITFDKESQGRVLRIARERAEGREIADADEPIAAVLDMHPEFDRLWLTGEMAAYPQNVGGKIVNPFVHTVLHAVIDRQIRDQDPEFVEENFKRLTAEGMDGHECLHAIMQAFAEVYFGNFRQGRGFDYLDYRSRLDLISVGEAPQDRE
jgi:hypothetical protein